MKSTHIHLLTPQHDRTNAGRTGKMIERPTVSGLFWAFHMAIMAGLISCNLSDPSVRAPQWEQITLEVLSAKTYQNPYTDVSVYAVFSHSGYGQIRRPAFWDGEDSWKIRFASPVSTGRWTWETFCSNPSDEGLHGQTGSLRAVRYRGNNPLIKRGLLGMSEGGRNVVHADGSPFFVVGDTPWALLWRATYEDALVYAGDRQQKGFNAALLMSFCPDRRAEGPDARATDQGFARAFEDIAEGHINEMIVSYFQYTDSLISILIDHGIVPVYQPIFHGFGWKGQGSLGNHVAAEEYERYMIYLIARYGARPAFWLVCGDGDCRSASVEAAGLATHKWDDYQQPTGLHYSPYDDGTPSWWDRPYPFDGHRNMSFQAEEWLDFQWCQTGHGNEHQFHKVERMYDNKPTRGVANGEPTYEGLGHPGNGSGWWQGHDAWGQLMHGGTMGVVYGAGGLWNWKITAGEEGWGSWANSLVSWRKALELPGSTYVGYVGKALCGLDIVDMERKKSAQGIYYLAKEPAMAIAYLEDGGDIALEGLSDGLPFEWFNPLTGETVIKGVTTTFPHKYSAPGTGPWVLVVGRP